MPPSLVIRDVIHGYVSLDHLDRAVLETKVVQRLRFIRQNDVGHLVFPTLNTTRLEHSLGVMHVAEHLTRTALQAADTSVVSRYLDALGEIPQLEGIRQESVVRAAKWYGLLHDLGHLPYSHLTEECLRRVRIDPYEGTDTTFIKPHEAAGHWLILNDSELSHALGGDPAAGWIVSRLLSYKTADPAILQPFKDVVDSDVDADRIDSTARDGTMSGGDVGRYDLLRLQQSTILVPPDPPTESSTPGAASMPLEGWRVLFTTRAVHAIESLLFERYKLYRWIHYHPKVVAYKNALRHCFGALALRAEEIHARTYVTKDGYLDDAWLRARLAALDPERLTDSEGAARSALLFRSRDARSLWKRRDEYRALNKRIEERVSPSTGLGAVIKDKPVPILYHYLPQVVGLETQLNLAAAEARVKSRFSVSGLGFKLFEPTPMTNWVAAFHLAKHSDPTKKICLTDESQLIDALGRNIHGEPSIGVTVLGDPDRTEQAALEELFVTVAVKVANATIKPP